MKVADILKEKGSCVITVAPDAPLTEAASLLYRNRIGLLVVCDERGGVVGVLSERDVVRVVALDAANLETLAVRDVMSEKVVSCSGADSPKVVQNVMNLHGVRHMPVVDRGKLKGLVSSRDLLKYVLVETEQEAKEHLWRAIDFV